MPIEPEPRPERDPERATGMRRRIQGPALPPPGTEVLIRRVGAASDPGAPRVRVVIMPGCVFDRP